MQDSDLYWLAGWLEGEGSFMAGPPSAPNQPRISGATTDQDVADRVAALLGVKVHAKKARQAHWKPTFQFHLRGRQAVDLMAILRPLMGQRRQEQIDRAVASWSRHPTRILTVEQVQEIRAAKGVYSGQVVAATFGVSRSLVYNIWQGQRYAAA